MEDNTTNKPQAPTPPAAPAVPASESTSGGTQGNKNDNSSHKALAIVGYIVPILFFVPLISEAKNNAFAKYHANQQLNLLILWAVSQVIVIIPVLGWIISPLLILFGIACMIMGVINAANEQMKPLPVIGKWQLIN